MDEEGPANVLSAVGKDGSLVKLAAVQVNILVQDAMAVESLPAILAKEQVIFLALLVKVMV